MLFLQQFDGHFSFKSTPTNLSEATVNRTLPTKTLPIGSTVNKTLPTVNRPPMGTVNKTLPTVNRTLPLITEQDVYKQIEHIVPAAFYCHEKFYFVDSLFVTKKNNEYQVEAYSKPWGTCPRTHLQGDVWYTSIDPIPYTTPQGRMFDDFDSAIRYYYDFQPEHMSIVPKVDYKTVTVDLVHQSQNRIETNVDNAISTITKLVSQMVKLAIVIIILILIV